jgi:hypothetical protein
VDVLGLLIGAALLAPAPPALQQSGPSLDLSDRRHVRALHLDLLGRTPRPDELELAAAASADTLVRHLLRSLEFWEHWHEDELYYFLLVDNARPDAAAAGSLPSRLQAGTLDMPGAVREIVAGSAFNRANPGPDTFVSVVLEQLLGVDVQRHAALLEAGKKMYDGRASSLYGEAGSSQADVVAIVTRQPPFTRRLAERQYRRLVGADAPARDLDRWGRRLVEQPGAFAELVREWVLSPAYAERLLSLRRKTDLQFIRGLYVDLTGELPEDDELRRLRAALGTVADSAPLRAVIARSLLDRHPDGVPPRGELEPGAFVDESFLRFLGRPPQPDERAQFLAVLAEPDCQPATVLRALVTHPEYQGY